MNLQFQIALPKDVHELTQSCKTTFDDDTLRHTGRPVGGAPGYDDPEYQLMRMEKDIYIKILLDKVIIGGIILERITSDHVNLERIWIHPNQQNKKIGQKAMSYIHNKYPVTKWTLATPPYSLRNHYFYEKFGYVNKGWLPDCPEPLYLFERITNKENP